MKTSVESELITGHQVKLIITYPPTYSVSNLKNNEKIVSIRGRADVSIGVKLYKWRLS